MFGIITKIPLNRLGFLRLGLVCWESFVAPVEGIGLRTRFREIATFSLLLANDPNKHLALPTNTRLGWKGLPGANTLAYYKHS
jgi:hypothetical protein